MSGVDKVRHGLNKVTLVYRGLMGPADMEEPGPGIWSGEVELSRCRVVNMLVLLKGLAQGTGWEAEVYRALQVLDGDLRSDSRDAVLDHFDDSLHRATARAAEILDDPETRRFYGETDDVWYARRGTRLELDAVWRQRLDSLARLESFWVRSRNLRQVRELYSKAESIHDRLLDAALARENLRNLFWVYSARDHESFTADRFDSTLALGRQNLEALSDLIEQLGKTRKALRDAVVSQVQRKGRPAGSDDIESPFGLLGQGSRAKPHEYADPEKLAAAE
ncbi:MAG: hypothetical protein HY830_27790, partial [Actinobacteria bacterium]|nr:hypothetical protein [Actinomycetota bacterium]